MKEFNREDLISLSPAIYLKIKDIYEDYVAAYRNQGDEVYQDHIHIKYEHTENVCREISGLCQLLQMDQGQAAFAGIIALLHDIARYEQFRKYSTFADAESENHAEMAVKIIAGLGIHKELTDKQVSIMNAAILNHNLPQIPDHIPSQIVFYSGLLRDADKLDIWRVSLEYNIFHKIKDEVLPGEYVVPPELLHCFHENQIIRLNQVGSYYDSILFRLSWVYDLNFPFSVRLFAERDIAGKLLAKLPASPDLDFILDTVLKYIRQMTK
jgi:hypothetical protein